jgi:prephenate dehydrogenase
VEAVVGPPDGPDRDDWALESGLAAGGWASMTRLALGSPEMGAGIAATNAPAIAEGLRDVRAALDVWIVALEADRVEATTLTDRFRAARDRLAGPRADGG